MIKKTDKIFVAGHKGLVGSAILRKLKRKGYKNIITIEKKKLDLISQKEVISFLKKKNLNVFFWLQLKLVAFILIKNLKQTIFMKI